MPKRKATKAELEYGIGEAEVEDDGIEPEEEDEEVIVCLAADEEDDDDDEALIKEYEDATKALEKGDV